MKDYLLQHWRGEQPLSVAILVNGVVGYLAAVVALLVLGQAIPAGGGVMAAIALLVAWAIWAGVGIVRSALRNYLIGGQPPWRRFIGLGAIALVAVAAAVIVRDLSALFL